MASRPVKRRKLTPPPSDEERGAQSKAKIQKAFIKNAASWNLEQDYETRPRKGKKKDKESNRLPVKTADGFIQQAEAINNDAASVDSDAEWLGADDDGSVVPSDEENEAPKVPDIPDHEQIRRAKEELAKIASGLTEDPEEHPGAFKALAEIGQSRLPAVQKLCVVTQMAVYKDVIPGYRIRPATEDGPEEKLSKDVRRVRTYEQALVVGYQSYIKKLAELATTPPGATKERGQSMATLALTCACTLLNAVPHFNFRNELLRILVKKLSSRTVDEGFVKCRQALETLFREDEEGRPAMEAVALLAKMMRVREYRVDESVLNLFLHLRLLSEFSGKASMDQVDKAEANTFKPTQSKQKREFRTKRERKNLKEQKKLDKDMEHADALVSHEERDKMQSETLKLVFATYFRALKIRRPHLMGATLEGLAKYAHLINQDFFGDLLEALKDLIRHSEEDDMDDEEGDGVAAEEDDDDPTASVRNTSREALLCTVTAFALLAGQDAHNARGDLHLDLSFFTTHLFRGLFPLVLKPDIEQTSRSRRLTTETEQQPSGQKGNRVNLQTTTVLLIRCLTAILLPSWNIRTVPPLRLAAFAKQLMSASLQVPEKSCQAILVLLNDVLRQHGKKLSALWNTEERKGDGTYRPLSDSVEGSNPFAATVWEGELLRKHYCPKVRQGLKIMEQSVVQK